MLSTPKRGRGAEAEAEGGGPAAAAMKRRRGHEHSALKADDITCSICLDPVAASAKPPCGHLLCQACAHSLWCCPTCRGSMSRPCPQCREEVYYSELQPDADADRAAEQLAKSLDPADAAAWRARRKEGKVLQKLSTASAIESEVEAEHHLLVSQAPSSRAKCGGCGEAIAQGSLRLHDDDGRYLHISCVSFTQYLERVCAAER